MSPPPATPSQQTTNWIAVLAAFGAGVVGAFQIGKMPSAIPVLQADLGLTLVEAGWVISMFNVIGVSTGIAVGAVADWFGHRRVILFGLVALAAGSALGAVAPGAVWVLLSRFVEGLGAILVFVAAPGLIARATRPGDTRFAFGIWSSYMPAGTGLMVFLTPVLIAPFGWRGLWTANAALLLAAAVVVALLTRDLPGRLERAPLGEMLRGLGQSVRSTLTAPAPLLLTLCFMTYAANYLAVLGFLPTFFIDQRGLASGSAAVMTAVAIFVNVFGNLGGGWILNRRPHLRLPLVMIGAGTMGLTSLGIYNAGLDDDLRFVLCLLFSGVGGLLPAAVIGAAPAIAPRPDLVATTNGLIMQGANAGQFVGPPLLAMIVTATGGWEASPWQVMSFALVGIAFAALASRLAPVTRDA